MKITGCVPLPGQGLVARSGELIALTDGLTTGPDPLLTVLFEVAAAGGDGGALARRAARAALDRDDRPAWACAGVTRDGELAVLVHGAAAADICVATGETVTLSGHSSVLPVSQLVTGTLISASLRLAGPGDSPPAPDTRLRLEAGIVGGGGVAVTVTAETAAPDTVPPVATSPAAVPLVATSPAPVPLVATSPAPVPAVQDEPVTAPPGMTPIPAPAPIRIREPDPDRPFESVLLLPSDKPQPARDEPVPSRGSVEADGEGPAPVLVDGVLCARQHFNDPNVQYCRVCGIGMVQLTRRPERRPRPPLGVLLLDDGTGLTLDTDHVLGREPALDADVAAGRARAAQIADPGGTVSRLHLRVSLVGWQVEVSDLGSSNGSAVQPATGPEVRLVPHEPVVIEPGARVAFGRRSFQYLSYRSS